MICTRVDDDTAGAVYPPAEVIVPTLELPPAMPFTSHVTESSAVLATVAVKACVPVPAGTLPDPGHTATSAAGAAAEHDLVAALIGAVDTAEVGLRTTFAVSTRPASSVTAI